MALEPGGLVAWLIVGLVAGWLAGQVMKGGGYGLVGDLIVGIIGAFVGGLLFGLLLPGSSFGFIGSIVVAFIGAVVFIAILRALPGRSRVSRPALAGRWRNTHASPHRTYGIGA